MGAGRLLAVLRLWPRPWWTVRPLGIAFPRLPRSGSIGMPRARLLGRCLAIGMSVRAVAARSASVAAVLAALAIAEARGWRASASASAAASPASAPRQVLGAGRVAEPRHGTAQHA